MSLRTKIGAKQQPAKLAKDAGSPNKTPPLPRDDHYHSQPYGDSVPQSDGLPAGTRSSLTPPAAPDTDLLTISFPDLSPAESSIIAQEIHTALITSGVPREVVRRSRSEQNAQLIGEVLVIAAGLALPYLDSFLKGAAHKAGERAVDAILRKWGTSARIERTGAPATVIGEQYRRTGLARTVEQARTLSDLKTLGVILIGAKTFPHYPPELRLDNDTFGRSARLMQRLLSSGVTVFESIQVLDLFDQDKRPEEIVDAIEDFLKSHGDMRDVIIYYCGHGDILSDRDKTFYVLLKGTRPDRVPTTGLTIKAFKTMIDHSGLLTSRRCTFLLDCCFAGQAQSALQLVSAQPIIDRQLADLPSRGFALLAASDRNLPAYAGHDSAATMFASALAEVLNGGRSQEALSLGDLCEEMTRYIKSKHGQNGVLPQCYAVDQSEGDLTRIPMFLRGNVSAFGASTSESKCPHGPDSYGFHDDGLSAQECTKDPDAEDEEQGDGFPSYSEFVSGDAELFNIADNWLRNMTAIERNRIHSETEYVLMNENFLFKSDAMRAIDDLAESSGVPIGISVSLIKFRIIVFCAITAHMELLRGTHYIVRDGQIVPLDEEGRPIAGERLPFGFHQAVQAKEHVDIG